MNNAVQKGGLKKVATCDVKSMHVQMKCGSRRPGVSDQRLLKTSSTFLDTYLWLSKIRTSNHLSTILYLLPSKTRVTPIGAKGSVVRR
jgi:hypothetical protein